MALLELDSVEKHFGGLPAVDGVTLNVDEGEILAVVGPNGAGKSTLLKLMVGLERPSGGRITFAGNDITGQSAHRVRRQGMALVQQTSRHFANMTAIENVAVGSLFGRPGPRLSEPEALANAAEMLDLVGLADRADEAVGSLNLHHRRFLDVARALAGQPKLLLLDEVMAGLNDAELADSIQMVRAIRDRHNITIIWVEHVMKAVLSLAERVVVLDFGRRLASGLPSDVMRDPAVIEAYLGAPTADA